MPDPASSPELVLVAPAELAAAARLALPERPWEQFATRRHNAPSAPARPSSRPLPARVRRSALLLAATAVVVAASVRISAALNTITPTGGAPVPRATPAPVRAAAPPAGAGYVIEEPRAGHGTFRIDPTGRFIVSLHVETSCGPLAVARIAIAGSRRFAYAGAARSSRAARVTISGAFHGTLRAQGVLRVRSRTCDTGAVPLSARLS